MEEQHSAGNHPSNPVDIATFKPGAEVKGRVVKIGKAGAVLNVCGYPGFLHVSELARRRPGDAPIREGDELTTWVSEVDTAKKRLLLTLKRPPSNPIASLQPGDIVSGKVVRLAKFGAFVDIGAEKDGLIHVSELAHVRIQDPSEVVSVGDEVRVKVLSVDKEKGQISLSLKATTPQPTPQRQSSNGPQQLPTLMQLAWEEAFAEKRRRDRQPKKHRRERERGMPRGEERDDLFLRTLRYNR